METLFKIVWMIVFFLLSAIGLYKTIQLDNTYESFKWCCFAAIGFTLGIIMVWSLIYKYFEKSKITFTTRIKEDVENDRCKNQPYLF